MGWGTDLLTIKLRINKVETLSTALFKLAFWVVVSTFVCVCVCVCVCVIPGFELRALLLLGSLSCAMPTVSC
jgi:hypothetical protein